MYKKIVKGVLVSVSVVFFTLVIGYITYLGTLTMLNNTANDKINNANSAEAVSSQINPESSTPIPELGDSKYFLAKLSGESIEIYLCDGDLSLKENYHYLYSFSIYLSDIPKEDLLALRQGVKFSTKEELASFEEDFNS